tara:strand:+ start:2490 stop:3149 length:660 start_codon:yes stop_codon:yes gene_type:complete
MNTIKMKVSVIITVFNREKYISRCIRSCLDQSMNKKEYEIIVVNDGSTDNSLEIIDSFGDDIVKISYTKNRGLAYASNRGIRKAKSKYIVRVDSDDYIHEDLLKIEYAFAEMNQLDAVSCDYLKVDTNEFVLSRESAQDNPIACGILFNKDKLIEIGLYDTKFKLMEDIDLRERFDRKFQIINVPLPLYRYLMHDSNITNNQKKVNEYTKLFNEKHGKK